MDKKMIQEGIKMVIQGIGDDVTREDLLETPRRYAEMCEEIFSGIALDPREELKVLLAEDHDEIVLVKDIPLYSTCEHHLLPFIGKAHVAYLPQNSRVTGLSKLARVVDILSKRLQVQERLTTSVADVLMEKLMPQGVMVVIEAEHLCIGMRGIKKPGTTTVTSAVRGIFRDNEKTRAEVLSLIKG